METKVSERFPEGYGDVSLQSSDGVICYFPKSVLSYASEYLRGIFHPPPSPDEDDLFRKTIVNPQVVAERAEILEPLLDYIDPKTVSPPLDPKTISDIMEAARKYDIPVIFHWFQREVNLRYHDFKSGRTIEPFLLCNPLITLSIAAKHNLETIGKLAIAELLGCRSEHLDSTNVGVPIEILDRIRKSRKARIKGYMVWTETLAKAESAFLGRPYNYAARFYHAQTCLPCSLLRTQWILWLIKQVQDSPRWATFRWCIEQPGPKKPACSDHQNSWSSYTGDIVAELKETLERQEEGEAVWPFQ